MTGESALLRIRVQPRAKRDEVVGERGGAVGIRLKAPPVDGKTKHGADRVAAGVPRSRVEIVRGVSSREKVIRASGLAEGELRRALGL